MEKEVSVVSLPSVMEEERKEPQKRQIELESDSDKENLENRPTKDVCPICLCSLEEPTMADTCFHKFCYLCILQWSQMGDIPRCPLCKQEFFSLIFDVKSKTEYRRFFVRDSQGKSLEKCVRASRPSSSSRSRRGWGIPEGPNYSSPSNLPFSTAHSLRRAVYLRNLRAIPFGYSPERLSLHSFQRNPSAWEAKLKPWLTRELQALLEVEDVEIVVMLVLSLLQQYGIHSESIRNHLREWLFDNTVAFIHELETFANSPHTMYTYDKAVRYDYSNARQSKKRKERKKRKRDQPKEVPFVDLSQSETIDLVSEQEPEQVLQETPVNRKKESLEYRQLKRQLGDLDDSIFILEKEREEVQSELNHLQKKLPRLMAKAEGH